MTLPGHRDLHDQLDALRAAVDDGELTDAAQRMSEYDVALRDYIEATMPHTSREILHALLVAQNALLLRMRERKAEIGAVLRRAHRQDTASRTYTAVEIAP